MIEKIDAGYEINFVIGDSDSDMFSKMYDDTNVCDNALYALKIDWMNRKIVISILLEEEDQEVDAETVESELLDISNSFGVAQ